MFAEVIRPQRPPAPPTDYFQINLGGFDPFSLHLAPRANFLPQGGYVGCVRGLKIADHVVDLSRKAQQEVDQGMNSNNFVPKLNHNSIGCETASTYKEDISVFKPSNIRVIFVSSELTGVLPDCNMKCDSEPCKNGGICTEDFTNHESSCDCELTSYFGEYCMEEKGADFNGESILQRKFVLPGQISKVRN